MSIPGGSAAGWATRCTPSCSVACAAKGSTALWAVIALPNEPSVRLHERHGFVRSASWSMPVTSWAAGTTSASGNVWLRGGDDVSSPPQPVEVGDG